MMGTEQDPKESSSSLNIGLDPEKTLDFTLFKCCTSQFMNPAESHESMARLIKRMEAAREPDEDYKRLPPLGVIIYKGTVLYMCSVILVN